MNRMINEKVAVSVARETGFAALNRFGAVLVNSVRRHFKRAAIERELARLDNRMLGDLGLARSEIGFVAQQAVAVPGELGPKRGEFTPIPAVVSGHRHPAVEIILRRIDVTKADGRCLGQSHVERQLQESHHGIPVQQR